MTKYKILYMIIIIISYFNKLFYILKTVYNGHVLLLQSEKQNFKTV